MNWINNFIQSAGNDVNQAKNAVGGLAKSMLGNVENEKLIPLLPNSPTIGQAGNYVANTPISIPLAPGSPSMGTINDFIKGQQNPANPAFTKNNSNVTPLMMVGGMIGADMGGLRGKASDVDEVAQGANDAENSTKLVHDTRLKQGTDNPEMENAPLPSTQENPIPQPVKNVPLPPTQETVNMANAKRNIQLNGKQVKTQDDINNVNNAWNQYGGQGTAHEQIQNVFSKNGAMAKLGQQANAAINAEGGTTASSDVENAVMDNLTKNTNSQEIGAKNMQQASQQYLDDVYTRAMNGKVTPVTRTVPGTDTFTPSSQWQELPSSVSQLPAEGGLERWEDPNTGKNYVRWDNPSTEPIALKTQTTTRIMPDQVDDSTLLKMKQIINGDANKTFSKDPTGWTTNEKIARYSRDALDTLIDTKHPTVANINDQMSYLHKGYEDMMTNANTESKAAQKTAMTPPPPPTPKGVPTWLKTLVVGGAAVPEAALGLKTLGVDPGSLVGGSLAFAKNDIYDPLVNRIEGNTQQQKQTTKNDNNSYQGQQPSNIHTYSQIPQSQTNVNPSELVALPSDITGVDGKPVLPTGSAYTDQVAQLQGHLDQLKSLGLTFTQEYVNTDAQLTKLKTQDPKSKDSLMSLASDTNSALSNAGKVYGMLNSTPLNFFSQFKSYADFMQNNDPTFAGLRGAMANLDPTTAKALFQSGSPQAAQAYLQQKMQATSWNYWNQIKTYEGTTNNSTNTTQPTSTGSFNFPTQLNPQGLGAPSSASPNSGKPWQGTQGQTYQEQ